MSGEAGKGDGRRKGADDDAYRSGYDRIFGAKHKPVAPVEQKKVRKEKSK